MKTQTKISIAVLAFAPLAVSCDKEPALPNVVLIVADDIGYGDIEWLTSLETVKTPNVKKLADNGIRFSNAYSTSATSTPSRFGLFTGSYPWRLEGTGIAAGDAAMIIKPEQYTMGDMFKSANYITGAVGKWHLGLGNEAGKQNWNGEITPGLKDIGFDYSFIMAATSDRVPCVYIENGKVVNLDLSDSIHVSYTQNFPGEPTGKNNPEMLRLHPSDGHNMSIVDSIPRIGFMKGGMSARWHDENIADDITNKAVQFIQKNKDNPFFLYFGTNDIHVPRMPHDRFKGKSGMGLRGDAILSFDWSVGEILKTLEELGIAENTLIILTSDNGPVIDDGYKDRAVELLGNHAPSASFRGGKYSSFEAGTRVPFIVSWGDKIKKTATSGQLISQIDILASLAKIIGAQIPLATAQDSQDFSDLLIGKSKKGREWIIQQNQFNKLAIQNVEGWKYIEPSSYPAYNPNTNIELGSSPKEQLYNLKNDPGEKNNLAERNEKELQNLRDKLTEEKAKGYLLAE